MVKYFLVTLKRLLKTFPYIFSTVLILLLCMFIAFGSAMNITEDEGQVRFRLALVCDDQDPYFMAGLDIVQAYDSTRFAIDTVKMDEADAHKALARGELDAYVVIPEGYIQAAMDGKLGTMKYVSTTGATDLVTLFKDEITAVVSQIIIACEKGMYAVERIAVDYDFESKASEYTGEISLKYVDYILDRSDMYYVDELGIRDSLGFDGYLFSGITVLVFSLMLIPAGICFINQDLSVQALLKSRNVHSGMQVLAEYLALVIVVFIPTLLVSLIVFLFSDAIPAQLLRLLQVFLPNRLPLLLLVIMNLVAFGYLVFQYANELVGGLLLYFFIALAFCFVSGCVYPDYFFPDVLRCVSRYTPQGISRSLLADYVVGNINVFKLVTLLGYTSFLVLASVFTRSVQICSQKR